MFLEISQLGVHYAGRPKPAVDSVSFSLQAGEIGVLIGPSGCGKTTLLRAVAGLEQAHAGTITLDGQLVSSPAAHVPAESRRIGMVFQDYALFPHLDVARNVGFGLMHLPAPQRGARIAQVLELVGLPASSSAWRWQGHWRRRHVCCCWTSRFRTSTLICVNAWRMRCAVF
jgi:iron(III) transport system ATP-binding protein